jgi:hypothetical protein
MIVDSPRRLRHSYVAFHDAPDHDAELGVIR